MKRSLKKRLNSWRKF